jgi:ureidoacrylate peracid hydrolase
MREPGENPITAFIGAAPARPLDPARTALLLVDMQYHDAHRDHGIGRRARERGDADRWEHYWDRLEVIVPRQQQLLGAARRAGLEIIYSVISALTPDCREIGPEYERAGIRVPPDSQEAAVLTELRPEPNDIVLRKSTASVFNSTTLDRILRNLQIDTLIVAGVLTRGCVESTVRDASDLGYRVLLVEDACGDLTAQRHAEALRGMRGSFAEVVQAANVISELSTSVGGGMAR